MFPFLRANELMLPYLGAAGKLATSSQLFDTGGSCDIYLKENSTFKV